MQEGRYNVKLIINFDIAQPEWREWLVTHVMMQRANTTEMTIMRTLQFSPRM